MVIYRGADGKPGYQQAEDIHDAVTFVEQMRNEDGVEHARIFRLEEVVFEYRPYYRVEIAGPSAVESGSGPTPLVAASAPQASASPASASPASVPQASAAAPSPQQAMASTAPRTPPTPSAPPVTPTLDVTDETSMPSLDESFDMVESTTINVDESEAEAVASNGVRRGLFGR
jgi:hypothetical protein